MSLAYHTFTEGNRTNELAWWRWKSKRNEKQSRGVESKSKQLQKEVVKPHKNERRIPFILFTAVRGSFFDISRTMNTYNVYAQTFKWIFEDDIYEKWKVEPAFFHEPAHTQCAANFPEMKRSCRLLCFRNLDAVVHLILFSSTIKCMKNLVCAALCRAIHAVLKQYSNHKRTFKMFRTQSVNKRLVRGRKRERESHSYADGVS